MTKKEKIELAFDYFQRNMVHHAMWFARVKENMGEQKAIEVLDKAWKSSSAIQMKRFSKILGFEIEDDVPKPLLDLSDEKIDELKAGMATNWLATDGVWFQAVEFTEGMQMAKACNDEAWGEFSPFEAYRIKKILDLEEKPGLEGLKKALFFRLYSDINKQSIANETEKSFDFFMNECRVQLARKRKGLDDYPCKSAGIVEYTEFAKAIDSRIKTKCISCPPDKHPEEYFCGWHFYID